MDLTEYPIKLYNSKRMAERIEKEVLNDYSEKEVKELLPIPILTDALAQCIGGIKKPLDLPDLEQKVNNLRNGTMEEKAVYLCFRKQLIDYDCMPVDEEGKPYDISLMRIPAFKNDKTLDELCLDDLELLQKVTEFCQKNEADTGNADDFTRCMNMMKEEQPTAYAKLYLYLVNKKAIPPSSMLSIINMNKDQFAFLVHYDKAIADEENREPLFPKIIDYATKNLQGTGTIDDINRTIATMRYGSLEEQAVYNKFCKIVHGLPIMPVEELPSVQEQRAKLLKAAKAMEPASAQKS